MIFLPIRLFLPISVLLCAATASSFAQDAAPPPQPPVRTEAEAGPNAITRAAVQRGILQCASRVEQVSKFLGFGSKAGALLLAPGNQIDQRMFSVQMELPAGASVNSFVDMSFAPNQANGCGASYQAITFWNQNCDAVAKNQFGDIKKSPAMKQDVTVLEISPASRVFLMKVGPSACLSIKKEIVS